MIDLIIDGLVNFPFFEESKLVASLVSFKDLLERELEAVGIRLNQRKPDIYFKQKKGGGISFNATCNLTHVDEKMVIIIYVRSL
jgi:ribosome-interacting GTPase 1